MKMNQDAGDICIIFSTVPPDHSENLAKSLLSKNLAACVNITPVQSLYRWKGEYCNETEHLLIIKTRRELAEAAMHAIRAEHPYEVPEILVLPVVAGHAPYIEWVCGETITP